MAKEPVTLEKEKETLLIPLYSKALEAKKERPILIDNKAVEIVSQGINYDFAKLRIPAKTQVLLSLRAKQLDNYVRAFLKEYPNGTVVHLACGLDSRLERVDNGTVHWYDLDFPEVIDLRKKFYKESERVQFIPSSVTDLDWLDIPQNSGGKFLFVAEGLFMYLKKSEVKTLFSALQKKFPGAQIAIDVFSTLTVKMIDQHPSIEQTKADLYWGIDHSSELEQWDIGVKVLEEWYFAQSPELTKVSLGFRLTFKLAGLFPFVNKAHRILFLQLGR